MKPLPVIVDVGDLDTVAMLRDAIHRHDEMSQRATSYGRSTLQMHDVGLLGERAVAHWLAGLGVGDVVPIADTPEGRSAGDVRIDLAHTSHVSVHVEVKTQKHQDFVQIGRRVNAGQLERTLADVFVWCVVDNVLPSKSVQIMGWLPAADLRTDPDRRVVLMGRQRLFQVGAPMKDPRRFVDWLGAIPPF